MKKCPSCNATCHDAVEVCPICGHGFDDGPIGPGAPLKTMMGLPALDTLGEESSPAVDPKQTLFGFPAQKTEQFVLHRMHDHAQEEEDEEEDEDSFEATSIIPASQLNFDDDSDLRGTVAGRPLRPADASFDQLAADEGEDQGDRTAIVSGSAVFAASAKPAGAERFHAGTLMGMSVDEIEARRDEDEHAGEREDVTTGRRVKSDRVRGTAFGVPAVQSGEDDAADLEEDSDDSADDSPTQAWNPNSDGPLFDPDGRKKLLEKIRRSKPTAPASRETSQGIPSAPPRDQGHTTQRGFSPKEGLDLSALRKLKPKRELAPTPAEFPAAPAPVEALSAPDEEGTPAQGVVKVVRKSIPPAAAPDAKPPAGVGAYMFGRGEAPKTEEPAPRKGVPLAQIRPARPLDELETQRDLGDGLSDADFGLAETGVASGDLLAQAGIKPDASPFAPPRDTAPTVVPKSNLPRYEQPDRSPANATDFPVPTQPLHQPQQSPAQQAFAPQPQPQRQPSFQTESAGVYQTFDGGNAAPKPGATRPHQIAKQTTQPGVQEDPTVRLIQSVFAGLSGVITLVVLAFVVLEGLPDTTAGTLIAAFSFTLGVAALGTTLPFWNAPIRAVALVAIGVLLSFCALAFVAGIVPKMFLVLALAAFVAFMAAAFPSIARKLM